MPWGGAAVVSAGWGALRQEQGEQQELQRQQREVLLQVGLLRAGPSQGDA
jgi:hypothetical protein